MYGGQLLAQALAAAERTVTDDRQAHLLHAYFLSPGDVAATVDVQVERVRDGRSFSSRCVSACQGGRELFRMLVSFHIAEPGERFRQRPFGSSKTGGATARGGRHDVRFHNPARADEWLLFDQSVAATGAGRGLAMGRIFAANGTLVATCAQEGLIRWT